MCTQCLKKYNIIVGNKKKTIAKCNNTLHMEIALQNFHQTCCCMVGGNCIKYLENHLNEAKRLANESQSIEAGKDCVLVLKKKSFSREEVKKESKQARRSNEDFLLLDPR